MPNFFRSPTYREYRHILDIAKALLSLVLLALKMLKLLLDLIS